MYCRNCGEPILESESKCSACDAINGEGVDYCNVCGGHTTERTDYCRRCGAKLKTIVPKQVRVDRFNEIQRQVKSCKRTQGILKFAIVLSIIAIAVLVLVFIGREQPNNIPEPPSSSTLSPNAYIHETYMRRIGDTYYYSSDISDEVAEYWIQSREILSYILMAVIVLVGTFIDLLVQKSKYKRLLKALKEAKNVL